MANVCLRAKALATVRLFCRRCRAVACAGITLNFPRREKGKERKEEKGREEGRVGKGITEKKSRIAGLFLASVSCVVSRSVYTRFIVSR